MPRPPIILSFFALLVLYPATSFLLLDLGLLEHTTNIFPIWPPVGLALVFLILTKELRGSVPFLFAVIGLTNALVLSNSPLLSLGIALGSTLGPVVSYRLLKPILFEPIFSRINLTTGYLTALMMGATLSALNGNLWLLATGQMDFPFFPTGFIGWLVGDFIGMLLLSSIYIFATTPVRFSQKSMFLDLTFLGNTFLVFMLSYYLLTTTLLSHVEFFILIPLLIVLILHRERAIFINGIVLFAVGVYVILCPFGTCSTDNSLSFNVLHLQTFVFFVYAAGYILCAALNQGEALLKEQEQINEETLITFAQFIEEKDAYTAGHSGRVAEYSKAIAKHMGLSKKDQDLVYKAGLVHDIGKIITPESVLLKPGNLSQAEFELMKQHASVGAQMIGKIQSFRPLATIVRHHHEWFDGSGYPDGLKGKEIPLFSRIMIIADAFDAMTTNRIYKAKKTIPEAVEEIKAMQGTQFDPVVATYAAEVFSELTEIHAYEQNVIDFSSGAEAERFAYFFKDSLTGLYNGIYFDILMHHKAQEARYRCLNLVFIKGMNDYNHRFGWAKGDALLRAFATFLKQTLPDALLFRVYGDDFIILLPECLELSAQTFDGFEPLKQGNIDLSVRYIDLKKKHITSAHELEKALFRGI